MNPVTAPTLNGVVETALYVSDVARSEKFYRTVLGLKVLSSDDRLCALDVAGQQLLLLFKRGASTQPLVIPGGTIPPHDGGGTAHIGFSISAESLPEWEAWLAKHSIAIESRVRWDRGGASLYFRDPDGHLLELLTPGVWAIY